MEGVISIQRLDLTLLMILTNSTSNGCDVVWGIDQDCKKTYPKNSVPCFARAMMLLGENRMITPDKFLDEFVKKYTVDQAAFDIFASTTRKCVNDEVKHEPISDPELVNLMQCMLLPSDQLGKAFGCKFQHPLK